MMICDVCKKDAAVIQLTEVEGTEMKQLHLCERCAAERGVETTITAPKPEITTFLQTVQQQALAAQGDATRCTFCSSSFRDFRSTGRLGCARCYDAFEMSLRELLRRVHGNSRHVGRRYHLPSGEQDTTVGTVNELRSQLSRAIHSEQFELAATLRDQLRDME